MKKRKIWRIAGIVCLVLLIAASILSAVSRNKKEGIEKSGISTGKKNQSVTYDSDDQLLFIGSHDNTLHAYTLDGEGVWTSEEGGAYSRLIYFSETGLLYAGNEDGNVYIYDPSTGSLKSNINVQRRILDIDINDAGDRIALATATGSSKSNVLICNMDGEILTNLSFPVKQVGIAFASDGESVIVANSRGEMKVYDKEGEEQNSFSTNYSIIQMTEVNGHYWTISKNGAYYCFDENLNVLRSGTVTNTSQAKMASIGVDSGETYVMIGTEEGYLYICDGSDSQIYSTNVNTMISAFVNVDDATYMVGYSSLTDVIHSANLKTMTFFQNLSGYINYVLAILLVLFLVCLDQSFDRTAKYTNRLLRKIWQKRMAYILLLPTFLLIYFFNYRGIFTAFIRAFTDWSATNNTVAKMSFVGLDNFRKMFVEGYFLIGMKNLLILVITGILKTITVPVLVAWLVFSIRGDGRKYVHRFLFVLPIVVPGVISSMTWQKIYDPNIGLINEILGILHLENLQRVWLGDAKTAIWAIVFMGFPFIGAMAFLVYYGGFINIGSDVEESARIDGASRSQIFWKIQLPLIRPQMSIMITLTIIGCMQDFNSIYILTGGGPGTSTYVPALELYYNVAQFGRYGYACALGVILFVFTMAIVLISNRITREKE